MNIYQKKLAYPILVMIVYLLQNFSIQQQNFTINTQWIPCSLQSNNISSLCQAKSGFFIISPNFSLIQPTLSQLNIIKDSFLTQNFQIIWNTFQKSLDEYIQVQASLQNNQEIEKLISETQEQVNVCQFKCSQYKNNVTLQFYQWIFEGITLSFNWRFYVCDNICIQSNQKPVCPVNRCKNRDCQECKIPQNYISSKQNLNVKVLSNITHKFEQIPFQTQIVINGLNETIKCQDFNKNLCQKYGSYKDIFMHSIKAQEACLICGGGNIQYCKGINQFNIGTLDYPICQCYDNYGLILDKQKGVSYCAKCQDYLCNQCNKNQSICSHCSNTQMYQIIDDVCILNCQIYNKNSCKLSNKQWCCPQNYVCSDQQEFLCIYNTPVLAERCGELINPILCNSKMFSCINNDCLLQIDKFQLIIQLPAFTGIYLELQSLFQQNIKVNVVQNLNQSNYFTLLNNLGTIINNTQKIYLSNNCLINSSLVQLLIQAPLSHDQIYLKIQPVLNISISQNDSFYIGLNFPDCDNINSQEVLKATQYRNATIGFSFNRFLTDQVYLIINDCGLIIGTLFLVYISYQIYQQTISEKSKIQNSYMIDIHVDLHMSFQGIQMGQILALAGSYKEWMIIFIGILVFLSLYYFKGKKNLSLHEFEYLMFFIILTMPFIMLCSITINYHFYGLFGTGCFFYLSGLILLWQFKNNKFYGIVGPLLFLQMILYIVGSINQNNIFLIIIGAVVCLTCFYTFAAKKNKYLQIAMYLLVPYLQYPFIINKLQNTSQ